MRSSSKVERDDAVYIAAGGLGALLLGMALVPLRDAVSASSLAFPFLLLTIVIAEYGGRRPAIATALVSALSLDFFLTEPVLRLAIREGDDIVAFLGLAACGLMAAWFGTRRSLEAARAESLRRHLDLLREAQRRLRERGPAEPAVASILGSILDALPLAGAVVRDERGAVVASAGRSRPIPVPARLLPSDPARQALPFPAEGASVELASERGREGWLDVWGSGALADADARRSLCDVGEVLGSLLERRARGGTRSARG
jgi:two-component system sensor histidine kinase KdpD